MTLLRSLVAVAAIAAVSACGTGPSLPDADAWIDGTLIEFLGGPPSLDAPTSVLVEESLARLVGRAVVHVGSEAPVYLVGPGGELTAANRGHFSVGDRLQVWTTGTETRSDPAQVTAIRVHIIREAR